jgi:hypothetical protein
MGYKHSQHNMGISVFTGIMHNEVSSVLAGQSVVHFPAGTRLFLSLKHPEQLEHPASPYSISTRDSFRWGMAEEA